jgi:hypothetical protein
MRVLILIGCISVLFTQCRAQDSQDDYSINVVKRVLQQPAGSSASFLEKQANRLGDRASIALLKIFEVQELTKPETTRKILSLIHDAFVAPGIISIREDRKPRVTLFLLTYLEHEVNAPDLRREISQTADFVRNRTAAEK